MIPSRTFDKYFNWLFLEINQSSQQMLTDVDAMPARVNGIILLDREVGDLSAGHKTPWSPAGCQVWAGFPSNMKIQPSDNEDLAQSQMVYLVGQQPGSLLPSGSPHVVRMVIMLDIEGIMLGLFGVH